MMGTVKENLIAARALIDTPEKLKAVGSVIEACRRCGDGAFDAFMEQPGDERFVVERGASYVRVHFDSILDRFDRAIEAQPGTISGLNIPI